MVKWRNKNNSLQYNLDTNRMYIWMIILQFGDLGGINIWVGGIVVAITVLKCQCAVDKKDIN